MLQGDWQDSNPQAQYTVAAPQCGAIRYEDVTAPYFSYFHTTTEGQCFPTQQLDSYNVPVSGSAITGVAFYDGGDYPAGYTGGLFFGDYARGCLWFMGATNGIPDRTKVQQFGTWDPDNDIGLVSLERGPGGDIFIVDIAGGSVRRVRYGAVDARASADVTSGPNPLTVNFSAATSASTGATITKYQWDLDGDGTFETDTGTTDHVQHTYVQAGVTKVKVRVTDSLARTGDSDAVTIEAGKKPVVTMDSPAANAPPWTVGDQLTFSGSAVDGTGQPLPDADLLGPRHPALHDERRLPLPLRRREPDGSTAAATAAGGSFIAPDHSYPSHLELQLTAKDADGLTTTVTRRLDPRTVQIALASDPSGRTLTGNDRTAVAPFICTVIKGSQATVSAVPRESAGGRTFLFDSS